MYFNSKSTRRLTLPVLCSLLVFCVGSTSVRAYHYFYVKPPAPAKWASLPVNFTVDNGPTKILTEIQTAFNAWNSISTAKDVLGTPTLATGDFNAANFGSAW